MVPSEAAHDTVAALGEIGLLQFKDLQQDKSAFQKSYSNQVRAASAKIAVHAVIFGDSATPAMPDLRRLSDATRWLASFDS